MDDSRSLSQGRNVRALSRIGASVLLLQFLPALATAQTQQFLDAPIVKSRIHVQLNGKALQWEIDNDDTFRGFQKNTLFLAKTSIYVTYPQLNPLSIQATASVVAADDPSYAAITKLINGITSVATTVATPTPPSLASAAAAAAAPPCHAAAIDVNNLEMLLYGPDTTAKSLQSNVAAWINTIDTSFASKNGPQAIADGVAAIKKDALAIRQNNIDKAKTAWNAIKACSNDATTPATEQPLYIAASASDFNPRLEQLTALVAAANSLAEVLEKQYESPLKWTGPNKADYIISAEVSPTFDKMQTVTVKVVNVALKIDSNTGALSTSQELGGTVTFTVRKYSSLAPEIGAGAVFGTITVPQYGTSTNGAGQTVVARVSSSSVSVNPTVLANFVCRCHTGLLTPMFQMGAATSKTLPAILLGGGVRLFGLGKGDVAVGGGAMFAWYKDLQKLKVGDVVTGTQAIQSDLGFTSTPKVGGYLAIQYKF